VTEAEWLTGADGGPMLDAVFGSGRLTDRKRRLFAAAGCRRVWPLLCDGRSRRAVAVGEAFADGLVHARVADRAWRDARVALRGLCGADRERRESPAARAAKAAVCACCAVWPTQGLNLVGAAAHAVRAAVPPGEGAVAADILRDLFGPLPFRPVAIDPAWLRWHWGTVPAIAKHIYEDRAFHELPILADALADAGCENEEVIAHCRTDGPHARGCWVVDLILGKP
jgi:hypothetical protein